jgi:RNA polymerase sigma-70 factor (ECF subfamily)
MAAKILVNNLACAVEQHVLAAKRDVRREASMIRFNASLDRSTTRLEAMLSDHRPSAESDVSVQEQFIRLADALTHLSSDYRDVIVMRHLEGIPFATIAERMNRSNGATRMLWLRAIERLRQLMKEDSRS